MGTPFREVDGVMVGRPQHSAKAPQRAVRLLWKRRDEYPSWGRGGLDRASVAEESAEVTPLRREVAELKRNNGVPKSASM